MSIPGPLEARRDETVNRAAIAPRAAAMRRATSARCLALLAVLSATAPVARAGTDVLTNNYDPGRSGANLRESILSPENVQPRTFGRLYSYPVDSVVLAQPLVATDVTVPERGKRDVLYVATTNNSVYAFDARKGDEDPLWRRTFERLADGGPAMPQGIVGTPAIDRDRSTIYFVAGFVQGERERFLLHALDLADGKDKPGSPVEIKGSVRVDGSRVEFEPTPQRVAVQRAALALAKGKIVVAFGGDFFEGWVFAFDQNDLQAVPAAFCTTCTSVVASVSHADYRNGACTFLGPAGGIWQAGRGPVVDERGLVHFFTGNKAHIVNHGCRVPQGDNACAVCKDPEGCLCEGSGSPKVCRGPDTCAANESRDRGTFDTHESLVQLDPGRGLALTGWWRPANWNIAGIDGLERNDLDLGGSGPVLLPGTNRLIGGGKQGVMYTLDISAPADPCRVSLSRECLGGTGRNPVQSFAVAPPPPEPRTYYRHLLGGPVLWNRPATAGGPMVYVWRENDSLRAYAIDGEFRRCTRDGAAPTTTHTCDAVAVSEEFIDHHPGGILALSARDADSGTAIVWAYTHLVGGGPGTLMAYRALPGPGTPAKLERLWDSDMCDGDRIDQGTDFAPPTIANGRVYVATAAARVDAFGNIPPRECTPSKSPTGPGPLLQ